MSKEQRQAQIERLSRMRLSTKAEIQAERERVRLTHELRERSPNEKTIN